MGYNATTFPNIFKHRSIEDVLENSIPFRELVDAECYRHAYEFVCRVLQPSCRKGENEDEMLLPCRGFCREFMTGCGGRMNENIKAFLDCSRFPDGVDTFINKIGLNQSDDLVVTFHAV
ncbi:unnamed protein product [Acanthoscelides obtectus]|uniref:FZ domain-containing protein n=1 Tax=Acanthoscelides obtectus TaxID=200917 RepID=A0A9P0K5V3_ACAOB|nr:unnamed protein product [Acanthoscelides obtectus]CAK1626790.1 Secreted frizzled-related protein 2 [Acanthoscelides obtectus]